ncbi:RIP metalloprotease RseP [Candidatus Kaiserbacteria bacterium CG10_big_fil_rev_8_21_14_0_10_45_20]|uniref:Zinc metalloprotease n=1 Tax=Candidatus Kaiserbacteria bacterium CG10_big_fil_rev_8_21_14_0_10_45_20 TaxID=1974607 RepID=A0A2H0UG70_9BACT|nr:MAG: RIP metalloprotease RseP [Candidatus Kaiserbacteria bacterium CG10_big_fil_rev_8_21_14_0_10_45_20]
MVTILIFIAVLVVLIVGHEFGHFIAAKLSKMRVLEFGVGFPPKVFGKKVGDTEYTLNWIPFGGFVRIFGEDPKDVEDPSAFPNKPAILQAIVLFAGPFANVVLAFVLTFGALLIGAPSLIDEESIATSRDVQIVIGEVLPESPAETAGLLAGDRIVSISEGGEVKSANSPSMISNVIAQSEEPLNITVVRDNEEAVFMVTPTQGIVSSDTEQLAIGISMALIGTVSLPVHEAALTALVNTYKNFIFIGTALITLLSDAFTLSADLSHLAGPIGIATLAGDAASFGFGALLTFSALLSINLAIINLLPFPALDGGRLLFLAIEVVTRRRIPLQVAQTLNVLGFAFLILLMLAVSVQDVFRLVG